MPGPGERDLRDALQQSTILSALNGVLPPSGPILNLLRHVDPVPAVTGPEANVGPPEPAIAHDPDVRRAGASVVKVLGIACGLGLEGSGWVAGPGLVVTNAHVVAGEDDTTVTTRSGAPSSTRRRSTTTRTTISRSCAWTGSACARWRSRRSLSQRDRRRRPRLPGERARSTVAPARIGTHRDGASAEDSYGRGPVQRTMTPFRGEVRSGNSGGPVVDRRAGC